MELLTANEFRESWLKVNEKSFVKYGIVNSPLLNLKSVDKEFLMSVGLPEWAAPNIYFFVTDDFNLLHDRFFVFGEDRGDRKICIDTKLDNMIVVMLGGSNFIVMNKSIQEMCATIYCYMNMVDGAIKLNGKDSFIENNIPNSLINNFRKEVSSFAPSALDHGNFWSDELDRLTS